MACQCKKLHFSWKWASQKTSEKVLHCAFAILQNDKEAPPPETQEAFINTGTSKTELCPLLIQFPQKNNLSPTK
jgi:hypothetical protein